MPLLVIKQKNGIRRSQFCWSVSGHNVLGKIYNYILTTGAKWAGGTIKNLTVQFDLGSSMGYIESMTDSCESEGINFCGRFTILQGSCGNMCSFIIMADRETGLFVTIQNPNGYDDEFGAYGYEYRKDSRLIIANATLFTDDEFQQSFPGWDLKPKYYISDNNEFVLLK